MSYKSIIHRLISCFAAIVWLVNGLFCKILYLVPRHESIVARILGEGYAQALTKAIGVAEVGMAFWIAAGIKPRLNVLTQIILVAAMNAIEYMLAPDLLLFGKGNALFATVFIGLIYYNEFVLANGLVKEI